MRANSEEKKAKSLEPEIQMRSRASHPGPHLSCVPDLPLSPQTRRHDCFSRTAPARGCCICRSQLPICYLAMANLQLCGGQRPVLLLRRAKGEEAATPGQPVAQSAFLEVFPPVIHSRESPVTASSAAIIRSSQELSRFAEHTLRHFVALRKSKTPADCAETVDDESSLWKALEI